MNTARHNTTRPSRPAHPAPSARRPFEWVESALAITLGCVIALAIVFLNAEGLL